MQTKRANFGPRSIVRNANRRLYSNETSRYITLADIGDMIAAGRGPEIEVFDRQTRDDVTDEVLIGYVVQRVRDRKLSIPRAVLLDWLRPEKST